MTKREIVRILLLSPLYLRSPLQKRREMVEDFYHHHGALPAKGNG
ncbi:MAG: hypothetical protein OEY01_15915 [Desulfobulbaceae bacterium]|nr:hypothetical protein [Desulfobulbaceae bacterium]